MRWEVVRVFEREILPLLGQNVRVAVVGGGPEEPELLSVLESGRNCSAHWFGIESGGAKPHTWIDLNVESETEFSGTFDLVLSSQVIEHVWNVPQAMNHISRLAKPGAFVWIACPASNFSHGSPEYYSAGYNFEMLSKLGSQAGLLTVLGGSLGSQSYYRSTHWYQTWFSEWEYSHPWRFAWNREVGPLRSVVYWARKVKKNIRLVGSSRLVTSESSWATEAYLLAKSGDSF